MKRAIVSALACAAAYAQAAGVAPQAEALTPTRAAPRAAIAQRLDARLPLQAPFTDSTGRVLRLGEEFGAGKPVILVLGYYRCPQLCGLLMQGLIEATRDTGLPAADRRIVFVSIDPADTPADAAVRRRVALDYARFLGDDAAGRLMPPPSVDLLVGPPASVDALARSVGYTFEAMPADGAAGFAHPAGIMILTPEGRVSRYLMGVRFEPRELRAALVEAGDGRIGTISDRIALMCAHLDPRVGRWSKAVLAGMRLLGFATIALVAAFVWRQRARAGRQAR